MTDAFVAIDLGAESGRVVVVALDESRSSFELFEVHRFPTKTIQLPSGLHWDLGGIWREILNGLLLVAGWASENNVTIRSVGVDTWGVDWSLVDGSGELLGLPHAYRDPRNQAAFEAVTSQISPGEIYDITGIQIMPINSLFSLAAQNNQSPEMIQAARRMLFVPDLLHFFLSGQMQNEGTIASTSQLIDIHTKTWSPRLLELCGMTSEQFGQPVPPGSVIGEITKQVAGESGLPRDVQVVAPASHDTASAVAAIPAEPNSNWCFISSGTWSLVGAELDQPCLSEAAKEAMFTNEAGVGGTTRFLKNIAGLWLVQQCRRAFASRGQSYSYDDLTELANLAEPFRTLIDPAHEPFATPGRMLKKIDQFAIDTGQPVPETPGDYLRCSLESLALAYRQTVSRLQSVLGRRFEVIHIVGGGSRNQLLNQMTADATGLPVVAGPIEAAAIGNALVQAMGAGMFKNINEVRALIGQVIEPQRFEPAESHRWQEATGQFSELVSK
ncbi:MAG: rhamnulokinase [Pirellulaceae bacterium]